MFLMQEHNSKEYGIFLYFIKNYICCCWKSSLFDPLRDGSEYIEMESDSEYSTHDISTNHGRMTPYIPPKSSIDST